MELERLHVELRKAGTSDTNLEIFNVSRVVKAMVPDVTT